MRRLTFQQQVWIPLCLALASLVVVSGFGLMQVRSTSLAERERSLRYAGDMAMSIVRRYAALADSGTITVAQAKREALSQLRALRFGEDGYVAVVNSEMFSIMNPAKPETEGKYLGDYRDADGNYVYRAMAAVAKAGHGGFVDYWTPRPGSSMPIKKRSYVEPYTAWDWAFVTGAYVDDIDAAFYRSLGMAIAFLVVIGAVLSTVVVFSNRRLVRALGGSPEYAKSVVRATAAGDLTLCIQVRPNDQDSLIFQIAEMQAYLRNAVVMIQRSAHAITLAMEEIASGNLDLSQRTEEQAAALEQTAASMDDLRVAVHRNSDDAQAAADHAQEAFVTATRGNEVISTVSETMHKIAKSSSQVGEILGIIEGIAFQTNILALNAAVEAARAHDHGKGFAVVASEVRALAQRSSASSRDIESLIQKSGEQVQGGSSLATDAGRCMSQILGTVQQVDDLMKHIAQASSEQSTRIDQMARALTQMDSVTQENAALVEQAAAAAQAVRDQARELLQSVSRFTVA
ncbi:methyl-accepting chemotaxis protein [Paraburkholderia sediminicola]|uniref:methyl-accepting chemotaxis protein n=1 Tax=Paraburkholderia sediminicola TaxID=458836 RepID=UPI000F271BE1